VLPPPAKTKAVFGLVIANAVMTQGSEMVLG
jgi:hypothetical protein